MKQITLSIVLLSSCAALYSSEQPKKIESIAELFAQSRDEKGNTVLHTLIRRYKKVTKIENDEANVRQSIEDGMKAIQPASVSEAETQLLSNKLEKELAKNNDFKKFNNLKKQLLLETNKKTLPDAVATIQALITSAVTTLIAIPFDVNLQNDANETPLHLAVKYRIPVIVDALVKAGANPNTPCRKGFTPLALALTVATEDETQDNQAIITSLLSSPEIDITSLFALSANKKYPYFHLHDAINRSVPNVCAIITAIANKGIPNSETFWDAVNEKLVEFKNKAKNEAVSQPKPKTTNSTSDSDSEENDCDEPSLY